MQNATKPEASAVRWDSRLLRWSVAFVWLATGLGILHPYYREVGNRYLAPLGLPAWVMTATCGMEIVLGLRVALGRASTAITFFQAVLIAGFTTILAVLDPMLLVHPFGILTKNLPLLAVIGTAWLLEREGWTTRTVWVLRAGLGTIWITEGLLPKILFQQPLEWQAVADSGLVPGDLALFLHILGTCEAASGIAMLFLRGRPLQGVLLCQMAALVCLPVLVYWHDWLLWVHPFGPLTKNVPILAGTLVLWRLASRGGRYPA